MDHFFAATIATGVVGTVVMDAWTLARRRPSGSGCISVARSRSCYPQRELRKRATGTHRRANS